MWLSVRTPFRVRPTSFLTHFVIYIFGSVLLGNILVNLSTSFGSDIIKIGFVLSIAFSFPLVIFPCRASLYSLLYRKVIPCVKCNTVEINVSLLIGSFGEQ